MSSLRLINDNDNFSLRYTIIKKVLNSITFKKFFIHKKCIISESFLHLSPPDASKESLLHHISQELGWIF